MSSEIIPVSCDTEHPEINANITSDMLPEFGCDHQWVNKAGAGYRANPVETCINCYVDRFEFTQWFAEEPMVWPIEDWQP